MLSDDIGSFAWNEAKSERCRLERGFSFAFVIPAFGDPDRRIEIDDRRNYGETRYRLVWPDRGPPVRGRVYAARSHHLDHFGPQGEPSRKATTW